MRPSPGLDPMPTRPRKHSDTSNRPYAAPTTFFLTRDPDQRSNYAPTQHTDVEASPVRTLDDTIEEANRQSKHNLHRYTTYEVKSAGRRRSTVKPHVQEEAVAESSLLFKNVNVSTLPTSLSIVMPMPSDTSIPATPRSSSSQSVSKFDNDISNDESNSIAITSSEDELDDNPPAEVRDSVPQLIMPSIKMPSRRPFTERGKQIGRFKILVAGSKGSGRTSLIKSIVQLCEDIVHVDPISYMSKSGLQERSSAPSTQPDVHEIYASTKPFPPWWSDLDESRVLRRRKSVGDAVLERNICFVDTSNPGRPDRILQYLEQQLLTSINSVSQAGKELNGLLSGRGGTQVDVILYLLTKDTLKEDCNQMQRMSRLCSVVPLIAKADLLDPESLANLSALEFPGVAPPLLPGSKSSKNETQGFSTYSVSSANGSDVDNMDASLLMSPEYVQPLMPSDLGILIQHLFDPDTVAYLRYASAKKLVSWYSEEPRLTQMPSPSLQSPQPSTLNSPLPTSLTNSGILIPVASEVSLNTSNSYALAKVADHTQREEHLAQLRLSKWASDLQLSLQRERERYENLAQTERALWLVQRMGEEVRDGQLIPIQDNRTLVKINEKSRMSYPDLRYEAHDPLGLLRWQDIMRTRGWAALQILGSFGVVGGVALWLAKTWGVTASLQEWVQEWTTQIFGTND